MSICRKTAPLLLAVLLPVVVPTPAAAQQKSETKALLWSLLGTVVPAGAAMLMTGDQSSGSNEAVPALLFLGGTLVGPSLGHFYAGRSGRAFVGIGVRAAAWAGLTAGFAAAWNGNSGGDELMLAGLILGGGVLAYDIIRAPHSARVHNKRVQSPQVSIGLTGSTRAPGVRIGASFSF